MPSILLLDDDLGVLAVLSHVFQLRGFDVVSATSGDTALDFARSSQFDCALVDVNMPAMDGLTFCRRLAEDCAESSRPVPALWIMTGAPTAAVRREARIVGALAVLSKPFEFGALLREIDRVLAKRDRAVDDVIVGTR